MEDSLEMLADNADEGGKWLDEFIKNPKPTEKDFKKARIITSHRSTQVRAHAVVTGRERQKFSLAKLISGGDSEEAQKYLEASKPK